MTSQKSCKESHSSREAETPSLHVMTERRFSFLAGVKFIRQG